MTPGEFCNRAVCSRGRTVNQAFERVSGLFQVEFDLPEPFGNAQVPAAHRDAQMFMISPGP